MYKSGPSSSTTFLLLVSVQLTDLTTSSHERRGPEQSSLWLRLCLRALAGSRQEKAITAKKAKNARHLKMATFIVFVTNVFYY